MIMTAAHRRGIVLKENILKMGEKKTKQQLIVASNQWWLLNRGNKESRMKYILIIGLMLFSNEDKVFVATHNIDEQMRG